jgi:hypothetical protein
MHALSHGDSPLGHPLLGDAHSLLRPSVCSSRMASEKGQSPNRWVLGVAMLFTAPVFACQVGSPSPAKSIDDAQLQMQDQMGALFFWSVCPMVDVLL